MEQQVRAGLQLAALAILVAACDVGPDNSGASGTEPNAPNGSAEAADDTEGTDSAGDADEAREQPPSPIDYRVEFDVENHEGYSFAGDFHFWATDPESRIENSAPGYARFVVDMGAETRARNTTEGRNADFIHPAVDVWAGPDTAVRDCTPPKQGKFFAEPWELPDDFCTRLLRIQTANTTSGGRPQWKRVTVSAGDEIRRSADSGTTTVLEGCEDVVDTYVEAVEEGNVSGFILTFPEPSRPEITQGDWPGGQSLVYDSDGMLLDRLELSPVHWLGEAQRPLEDRDVIEC